ncbi:MAG: SRPBCC domain-containing protein, partial [Deltaproteobacteria bacterium]|nr:SRPBCC domain-containing protein [Deltaproteobacteria bacterium]
MAGKNSGKLKVTLPSDTEILLSRVFDAPRHLVFDTMTKPEYVRQWWCCMDGYTMPVCEIDFRVGGKWRYVMVGTDGAEVGFHMSKEARDMRVQSGMEVGANIAFDRLEQTAQSLVAPRGAGIE